MPTFTYQSEFFVDAATLFKWHERPGAFERLNPPFMPAGVLQSDRSIRDGSRVVLRVPDRFYGLTWNLEHEGYIRNRRFTDRQTKGPFRSWHHEHRFENTTSWRPDPERTVGSMVGVGKK